MIDALQDGSNNSLLGLIAGSMPAEEAKPSWLQHPMRHLQKKIASGDTEEGAYPAEPRGMLNSPILADFAQTNSPTDGSASAIGQVAPNSPQAAPVGAFGSLAPAMPQSAPARPVTRTEAPAGVPAAVRRNVTPASPASTQVGSTITVHAPDGSIVVYPAGTSAATINEEMTKYFGRPQSNSSASNFWESDPIVAQPKGGNFWDGDPIVGAKSDISANNVARSRPLTLNIEGRKVNVDDSFSKLSPEEQNKTVDEIHSSLSKAPVTASNDRSGSNTINVKGPDGSNFIFPAGTPTAEIRSALEGHYGTKQSRTGSEWDAFPPVSKSASSEWDAFPVAPPLPPGYMMDVPPLPPGYQIDKPREVPVTANNLARSASTGVMIGGGLLNKLEAATNATLAPVLNPFFDQKDQLTEPTWSGKYAHSLRDQEGMDKAFEAQHPVVDTAAKLAGGVAATIPLAATRAGATALGLTGETLGRRVVNGAVSGAALTGADAAIRGEDWKNGALLGGGLGAAAPVVGQAVGKVAGAVMNKLRPQPVVPQNVARVGNVDIPLTTSQVTGNPAASAEEQIIARGGRGEPAQETAQTFLNDRNARLAQVHSDISAGLDPTGQSLRTAPEDAGQMVSAELASQEAARKAARSADEARVNAQGIALRGGPNAPTPYDAAETIGQGVAARRDAALAQTRGLYDQVRATPGEFDSSVPKGLAEDIRSRLNKGEDALWVDPQSTSKANEALRLIDQTVGNGLFKNAAAPVGPVAEAAAVAGSAGWQDRAKKLADEMIAQGVNPMRARAAAAASEGGSMAPHSVAVPSGGSVDVVPKVVEASRIRTSADPGYDPALQPRDRARAASDAQVNDIANNLNPNRLGVSSEADRGAPIVGPDGMVESGNGRVLGIRRAYEQGGESASKYRDWLAQQGVDVSKFRQPVLVRERATPMNAEQRKAFTVGANQSSVLSMSAPEKALADARIITPESLSLIRNPADLGAVENLGFVRHFVSKLPQTEQGALMTASGDLSSEGLARVRNAVLGKAYGDTPILNRIAESTNDEVKGISNALTATAPEWAALREAITAGHVPANLDVTNDLINAVQRTAAIRSKGVGLADSRAQLDAFNKPSAESDLIQRMFYGPDGRSAAPASQVANALRNYAQEAAKVDANPGLGLGLAPVTAKDILESTAAKIGAPKVLAKEVTEKSATAVANTAEVAAEQSAPRVGLKEMDAARKRLVVMYGDAKRAAMAPGGSGSDVRAMGRILHEFDSSIIDAFESGKFTGDSAAARQLLTDARASHAEYKNTFTNRGGSDPVGRAVEKILGRYTDSAATPDQIAQLSYGPATAPGGGQAIQVAQRLKSILGETSPEWGAYKKGLQAHVEGEGPATKRADRIENFLRGTKGKGLANIVLSRDERQALGNYAQSLRGLETKPLNSVETALVPGIIAE
jgi:hypothetical protein